MGARGNFQKFKLRAKLATRSFVGVPPVARIHAAIASSRIFAVLRRSIRSACCRRRLSFKLAAGTSPARPGALASVRRQGFAVAALAVAVAVLFAALPWFVCFAIMCRCPCRGSFPPSACGLGRPSVSRRLTPSPWPRASRSSPPVPRQTRHTAPARPPSCVRLPDASQRRLGGSSTAETPRRVHSARRRRFPNR